MEIATVIRALRRRRRLSQRELAARSGVSASTIDRIESGHTRDPGIGVIDAVLNSVGYGLAVVDHKGRPLMPGDGADLLHDLELLRDSGGRHFPAHLPTFRVTRSQYWWGWYRIAWSMSDPVVPAYSYFRRPERWPRHFEYRADSAGSENAHRDIT
jgi:transcriptional regulator with XRE-family HTH domain